MGMGGGTILILLLSIFLNVNQHIAQATNLVFFIPTAIVASFIGIKNKNVNWKTGMIIIFFGAIGAAIGAIISMQLNVSLLRKFFGIFLLIIASYEIYSWYKMYRKDKKRHNTIERNENISKN